MDELRFYKKSVYGIERIYPVDSIKQSINTLTGRATLEPHHLDALVSLGFQVLVDEGQFTAEYRSATKGEK